MIIDAGTVAPEDRVDDSKSPHGTLAAMPRDELHDGIAPYAAIRVQQPSILDTDGRGEALLDSERWYSISEAARRTSIPYTTLRRVLTTRRLARRFWNPVSTAGGWKSRLLVLGSHLEDLLSQRAEDIAAEKDPDLAAENAQRDEDFIAENEAARGPAFAALLREQCGPIARPYRKRATKGEGPRRRRRRRKTPNTDS